MPILETGITHEETLTVSAQQTAEAMGSGGLAVLATPALIALMERTAMLSVAPLLGARQGTVGTVVDARHTAATPVGMQVTCRSRLVAVDGRRLTFEISAEDAKGPIGSCVHERFVIDSERFLAKALAKLEG